MFSVDVQICNIINFQVCYHYHGNRGTKIMGWGDIRYCFAMAILVFFVFLFFPPIKLTHDITEKLLKIALIKHPLFYPDYQVGSHF
jgi:hypothetical protein